MENKDIELMNRAIELAERGRGWVNPNPLVGAVIVKEGRIIAEGWHGKFGGLHAERHALQNCRENPAGATLYVTLEPCCHYGKTPPCTEAVIQNGISRVVVAMTDPNPLVKGKGIERLRQAGIEVVIGVGEEQAKEQNAVFLKYITTRLPWVVMKTAMTLDGKIATYTGDSKWVTGVKAREKVHEMRANYMGIMIGSGTADVDDPLLNCRMEGEHRQPVRIVVDSQVSLKLNGQLADTACDYRTILAYRAGISGEKLERLRKKGVELLECEGQDGHVYLRDLLQKLGAMGIDSVLLEGGGGLNEVFLRNGLIDEVYAFIAPKLIGGREAKTPVEGMGAEKMRDAFLLKEVKTEMVGEDILIRGKVINK